MNFPFDDAPNTVAITCCHIMNDNMPILHISHDSDDGMWQFLCGNPHDTSEGRIVSLHKIYTHDPTVAQLADMPCGYSADRQDITAAWRIRKSRPRWHVHSNDADIPWGEDDKKQT